MTTNTEQQQLAMRVEPQKEHRWLKRLVGDWSYEGEGTMEPGQAPVKSAGTERVRSLGDVWFVADGKTEMPDGSPATTVMTLGYDTDRKRFAGTWIGSMMTHLWVYDGELDEAKNVLTLNSEGPRMTGDGGMAKYRDVIELKSDDHRILTSHVLGDDGSWRHFMTATYTRTR